MGVARLVGGEHMATLCADLIAAARRASVTGSILLCPLSTALCHLAFRQLPIPYTGRI